MFSIMISAHFSKLCWKGIKRNISRSSTVVKSYAFLSDKSNRFLINENQWASSTLLQQKKYESGSVVDNEDKRKFMAVFQDIVKELTSNENAIIYPDVSKWFSELLQHNVPHGKNNRASILLMTYRMMAKPEDQTPENVRLAMILAWCLQILGASFLISDDIVDASESRHGRLSWHKRDGVGLIAINDILLLIGAGFAVIRKHFHDKPYYSNILNTFQDCFLKTAIGQCIELCTAPSNKPKLELFTAENYRRMCIYKARFSLILLPIELVSCMTGSIFEKQQIESICLDVGYFYQVENDVLDCYGDPAVTGKVGTDIEVGKCTWLAVTALQRASAKQRRVMETCYGSPDPQKVAEIKNLYEELGLRSEYTVLKQQIISSNLTNIQKITDDQMREVFLKAFAMLTQKYT